LPANLNPSNRPVRIRMPGGVAGDAEDNLRAPMPIVAETLRQRKFKNGTPRSPAPHGTIRPMAPQA